MKLASGLHQRKKNLTHEVNLWLKTITASDEASKLTTARLTTAYTRRPVGVARDILQSRGWHTFALEYAAQLFPPIPTYFKAKIKK